MISFYQFSLMDVLLDVLLFRYTKLKDNALRDLSFSNDLKKRIGKYFLSRTFLIHSGSC